MLQLTRTLQYISSNLSHTLAKYVEDSATNGLLITSATMVENGCILDDFVTPKNTYAAESWASTLSSPVKAHNSPRYGTGILQIYQPLIQPIFD